MKDIEKIKSEDLGCQVQDANPGNFAIEQEVAQLVGATVPAPTEPSADDARELGAQLLVFLRRALLPIRSALRTAVAAIYAHLDSRCTDYTPAAYAPYKPLPSYDPMRPLTPRTLPNLLTALTAFSDRKISEPNAIDGISLAQILCSAYHPTEIEDTNTGWTMSKVFPWSDLTEIKLGCSLIPSGSLGAMISSTTTTKIEFTNLVTMYNQGRDRQPTFNVPNAELYFLSLVNLYAGTMYNSQLGYIAEAKAVIAPKLSNVNNGTVANSSNIKKMVFGKVETWYNYTGNEGKFQFGYDCPNLIHVELGEGTAVSISMPAWNPTNALSSSASDLVADPTAHPTWKNLDQFLQNFREHIALRLAQQPADNPNHLTLTLSQAVFDTIWNQDGTPKSTDPDSVIYQINKIIKTDKHWSVNRA